MPEKVVYWAPPDDLRVEVRFYVTDYDADPMRWNAITPFDIGETPLPPACLDPVPPPFCETHGVWHYGTIVVPEEPYAFHAVREDQHTGWTSIQSNVVLVPEPATTLALLFGCLVAYGFKQRRST
jgi:hypothetical protein